MEKQNDTFYRVARYHKAAIEAKGFVVTPKANLDGWVQFMRDCGADINPSFDPTVNDIGQDDGLWIEVLGETGVVAAVALRRYHGNLRTLILTGRLWRPPAEAMDNPPDCEAIPDLTGWIVQRGGLWVVPAHRHKGIGLHLQRMALAGSFTGMMGDYCISIKSRANVEAAPENFALARYCIPAVRALSIGCPPTNFWLTYISRDDAANDLLLELGPLLGDGDQKSGDEALLKDRQDQPPEA